MTTPAGIFDHLTDDLVPQQGTPKPGNPFDHLVSDLVPANKPEKPPLLTRLKEAASGMIQHPLNTLASVVTAPVSSALTAFDAPVEGEEVSPARYLRGKAGPLPNALKPGTIITKANTPGAITKKQFSEAAVQNAVNAALPLLGPAAGVVAGAAYAPDDPIVGAILGGAAHATIKGAGAVHDAVVPDIGKAVPKAFSDVAKESAGTVKVDPEIASEMFARRAETARAASAAAEKATGETQATSLFADILADLPKAKDVAKATKPLEGLETPQSAVEGIASEKIGDQVAEQAKREAAATQAASEAEAQAKASADAAYQQTLGGRTPLGVERGIVRRPGGAPQPAEPTAPNIPTAIEPEAPRPVPTVPAGALPQYPEGFAMGGPEGRIPKVPKATGGVDAPVVFGEGTLPEPPIGEPKGVPASELLNPRTAGRDVAPDAFDAELARVSAKGLDKTRVSFLDQQKIATSFADAIGVDRLQLDPKAIGRMTGAEIKGMKDKFSSNMGEIETISKQLESGNIPEGTTPESLHETLDQIRTQNDDLLSKVVRATAQKGRDLGFLRQVAQRTLDPDVWVLQARRIAGKRLSEDTVADIRRLAREAAIACGGG